ncbi:probable low affinity copper uptake protein 2 isoform X2 [Corvus moneduloides]|uniref:probable low affinity copper uptake protein 2 isoform X2 n=1 Tax=Corvus moneduloides TaxID=1196302 RepID=UPI001363C710|nr:probable low affinity copper uptake protein 2 isoform X2 [Corvus moneduloides]
MEQGGKGKRNPGARRGRAPLSPGMLSPDRGRGEGTNTAPPRPVPHYSSRGAPRGRDSTATTPRQHRDNTAATTPRQHRDNTATTPRQHRDNTATTPPRQHRDSSAGGDGPGPAPAAAATMRMTFYFSDTVVLLFDFWNVHNPTGMVLSVLVILLLSVLYEAVKMGKAVLLRRALLALPRSLSQEALTEPQEGDSGPAQGGFGSTWARQCSTWCRWCWATW